MSIQAIWEGDDLVVRVSVLDDAGAAKELTGATVEAVAEKGGVRLTPDIDLSGLATGVIVLTWNDAGFTMGGWSIQCRASLTGEDQTVFYDTVMVRQNYIT